MHEMGITSEVLTAVLDAAAAAGAPRVDRVSLTVGELTEIVPDAMLFAWEALTADTIAEGSTLDIRVAPARSECSACGTVFEHDRFDRRCTSCGDVMTRPVGGAELTIDAVEVPDPEPGAGPFGDGNGE